MKTILKSAGIFFVLSLLLLPRPGWAQDSDTDGMPDAYENLYACLDPLMPDDLLDPDGDIYDNYTEYVNQTDPCSILFKIADSPAGEVSLSAAFDGVNFLAAVMGQPGGVQLFNSSGSRTAWGGLPAMEDFPAVAFDGINYLVAWMDYSLITDAQVMAQLVSPAGDTLGQPEPVSGPLDLDSRRINLSFGDSVYLIAWEEPAGASFDTDIYGQIVSTAGVPIGSVLPIATDNAGPESGDDDDGDISIAFDGTNFLVIFTAERRTGSYDGEDVYGQFVSPAGSLSGGNFAISENDYPSSNPTAVIYLGPNYLALWSEQLSGDTSWDIVGIKVSTSGTVVGSTLEFAGGPGGQFLPTVVSDGSGIMVAWNDQDTWDVMGRYFSSTGPVGPVFPIWADDGNQLGGVVAFGGGKFLAIVNQYFTAGDGPWTFDDVYGRFLLPLEEGDTIAPTAPGNLTAWESGNLEISLSWDVSSDATGVAGYNLYWGAKLVETVSPNYIRVEPPYPMEVCLTVRAFDFAGNLSVASSEACASCRLQMRVRGVSSDLGSDIVQAGHPGMIDLANFLPSPASVTVEFYDQTSGIWLAADDPTTALSHNVVAFWAPAGLSSGASQVRVTMDGRVSAPYPVTAITGSWLPGIYTVQGKVTYLGSGVPNAWVLAMAPGSQDPIPIYPILTDAMGSFVMYLDPGDYMIVANQEGGGFIDAGTMVTVSGDTTIPDFVLEPGLIYSGHVADAENSSLYLGGGRIEICNGGSNCYEGSVYVDGSFQVIVPSGTNYGYRVELDSSLLYLIAEGPIGTIESNLTDQVITAQKADLLRVRLVNESTQPVAGLRVIVNDNWYPEIFSGADGYASVPVSSGETVQVEVRNDDYLNSPYLRGYGYDVFVPPGGGDLGDLTVYSGFLVTGQVQNEFGDTVWGHLDISSNDMPPGSVFDEILTCTDISANGLLVGRAYPGDNSFNIGFYPYNRQFGTAYLDISLPLTIAGDTDLGLLVAEEGVRMTGHIVDGESRPVTNAEVRCDNNTLNHHTWASLENGDTSFAIALYPGEDYDCQIRDYNSQGTMWFPANPYNCSTDCDVGTITFVPTMDSDGDGLSDDEENFTYFTNPFDPDSDDDGLWDGYEVHTSLTDPLEYDTDGDGLGDGYEVHTSFTDPLEYDTDGDGLGDGYEVNALGTDPNLWDTDGDGMPDGWEYSYTGCGLSPLVGDSTGDPDADSQTNLQEYYALTDPCVDNGGTTSDTDSDGMPDAYEQAHFCLDYLTGDSQGDGDTDGLANLAEYTLGTDPCDADSDDDTFQDDLEVILGSNPMLASILPTVLSSGTADRITSNGQEPSLAYGSSEFGMAWRDSRDGNDEIYFNRVSKTGAVLGSDLRVSSTASDSWYPSLVWGGTASSEYGLAWEDFSNGNYEIYFMRISATGSLIGSNIRITSDANVSRYPSLAWSGSEYGVSWADNRDGNYEIYFARFSLDGTKIGPDLRVTSNGSSSSYPSLAWNGSELEFGVSWTDNRDGNGEVYFTRLSAAGTKIGSDLRITNDASATANVWLCWSGFEYGVSFTDSRAGNEEIYFAHFDSTGTKIGSDVRLSNATSYSRYSDLSWGGGVFGVTWQDYRDGNYEIYFAQVSPAGVAIGTETRITNQADASLNPIISSTGSRFALAWNDSRTDAPGNYFQILMIDNDGDGLDVLEENTWGTNFEDWDTDDDGMDDGWEVDYNSCVYPLSGDSLSDPDGDLVDNLDEYLGMTDPCINNGGTTGDIDSDGMPDSYEQAHACLNYLVGDSLADGDTDGLANLAEYTLGTDPCDEDSDNDLMPDGFEVANTGCGLNPLFDDSLADPDGDNLDNLGELAAGTNPCYWDTDSDGMLDGWEYSHGLNPLVDDTAGDPDADAFSNWNEYLYGTNPQDPDSDDDGMPDGWEVTYSYCGLSPIAGDSLFDSDFDALDNLREYQAGTSPCYNDSDADGMTDGWEVSYSYCGLDPLTDDAYSTQDEDGLTNIDEYVAGTNPCLTDTDGDGMNDSWEVTWSVCGMNPLAGDSMFDYDLDGQDNLAEYLASTNPCANDSDSDGMPDDWELANACAGISPIINDAALDGDTDGLDNLGEYTASTDPCDPDSDDDGLWDGEEVHFYLTNPLVADSDGDSWGDGLEVNFWHTDPAVYDYDSDADGLPDAVETNTGIYVGPWDTGTDPYNADGDADGVNDGKEMVLGSNPLSPLVTPTGWGAKILDLRVTDDYHTSTLPSLAWTGSEFGVSWVDSRDGNNDIYFARVSAAGIKVGPDVRVTDNSSSSEYPVLAWTGSEFGVTWVDNRDGNYEIYFARLSADGAKLGQEFRVSANGDVSEYPSLAWTGSEFGVCWHDYQDGNTEIYFARISAAGVMQGSEQRVTSDMSDSAAPSLSWTGSEFGVSWHDYRDGNYEIYFARLSAMGDKLGDDLRVTAAAGGSVASSLAWTGSEFGVSWYDGRDAHDQVYFARISAAGDKQGEDLRVTVSAASSDWPSLVWAGSEFGVTWHDNRDGNFEIYFARVTDAGVLPGSEVRVTATAVNSYQASVAWTGSEFGLAWFSQDTNNEIYFARIGWYDPDGDGLDAAAETAAGANPSYWDTDHDGMSDGWEVDHACAGISPLIGDSTGDADGDSLNSLAEFTHGSDPCDPDTDGDLMPDGWEYAHDGCGLDLLVGDSTGDADTDGLPNLGEFIHGADPCDPDTDGDLMPDGFEVGGALCGLNPLAGDSVCDNDADSLDNLGEYQAGTDPCNFDTDGDLMSDGWEINIGGGCGLNPLVGDSTGDADGDGLPNLGEYQNGGLPCNPDTDFDTMPDGWEYDHHTCGLNLMIADATADAEPDGIDNLTEYILGSDPCDPDSDDDLMPDGWEYAYAGCGLNLMYGDSTADADYDGLPNLREYQNGGLPCDYDTDDDSMPDGWEYDHQTCGLNLLVVDMTVDADSDGLDNLTEYSLGADPCDPDSDDDLMPDGWEFANSFCGLSLLYGDSTVDADGDGLNNLGEYQNNGQPCNPDTDADTMPDGWEYNHRTCGLDLLVSDATADAEPDGLDNLTEYSLGSDPCDTDTDDDLMPDGWEYGNVGCGLNLIAGDSTIDADGDGLDNLDEFVRGTLACDPDSDDDNLTDGVEVHDWLTNPLSPDTDGDFMTDDWEVLYSGCGLEPTVPDAYQDEDTDGFINAGEFHWMTNPCLPDTDGDGRNDGDEVLYGSDPIVANGVPISSASSPAVIAGATVTVNFLSENEPTSLVRLYVSWNGMLYQNTGLSARAGSGEFVYVAQYGPGTYRFFTRAEFSPLLIEPMKSELDTQTIVDWGSPESVCLSPAWAGAEPFEVSFFGSDESATVRLFYRKDGGDWTNSGLTETGAFGAFWFTASGSGSYDFYTIGTDSAGNVEAAPASYDSRTQVDTTPPIITGMTVSFDGPYLAMGSTVDINWTEATDPDSAVFYTWALGTTAGGTEVRPFDGGTESCDGGSCSITLTGLALPEGAEVYASVIAHNQGGTPAAPVVSASAMVDTRGPELVAGEPEDGDVISGNTIAITVVITDRASGIAESFPQVMVDDRPLTLGTDFTESWDGNTVTIEVTALGLDKLVEIVPGSLLGGHSFSVFAADEAGNPPLDRTLGFTIEKPGLVVITPSTISAPTNGDTITFRVYGGISPYEWTWTGGDAVIEGTTLFYAPGNARGSFNVAAVDARGVSFTVPIKLEKLVFQIQPQAVGLAPGEFQQFKVIGGTPPYTWFALGGTIEIGVGETFDYTAGNIYGENTISVVDSATVADIVTAKITITRDPGRAIIIIGGGLLDDNRLVNNLNYLGNFAYRTLISRGFTPDKIFYLNPNPTQPFDGNGDGYMNDIDAAPSLAKLQYAITDWAAGRSGTVEGQDFIAPATSVSATVPLTVYLIDHGGIDSFLLNRTLDGGTVVPVILSATDLDSWIDQIQAEHPCRANVILDSCYSGTFIDNLGSGAVNRIVITSASGLEPAFFTVNGTVSFSQFLLNAIMAGQDIKTAFNQAAAAIRGWSDQRPQLDDNGDGTYVSEGAGRDGFYAEGKFLGSEFFSGADTPDLVACPAVELSPGNTASVCAELLNSTDIAGVFAVITPPGFDSPTSSGNFNSPKLEDGLIPIVYLTDPNEDGIYSFTFSAAQVSNIFKASGDYTITIYAKDVADNVSSPVTTHVFFVGGDAYEPDDTPAQATVFTVGGDGQLHNHYAAADEDWVSFGATIDVPYVVYTDDLSPNADTRIEIFFQDGATVVSTGLSNDDYIGMESRLYFTPTETGTYFVRVIHSLGLFGVGTDYTLFINSELGGSGAGSMEGHVTDSVSGFGVYGASVKMTVGGVATTVTTTTGGYFIFNSLVPGTYSLLVRKSNYTDYTAASVTIQNGVRRTQNVNLAAKSGTGVLAGTITGAGGAPLGGVRLNISGIPLLSNTNGTYSIRLAQGSTHTLSAQTDGYADYTASGIVVTTGQTTTRNFAMVTGDSDGDGLIDTLEAGWCTSSNDPDTDDDGINDGVEDANHNGVVDPGETNPCDDDSDDDEHHDGADCNPLNAHTWDTCATCVDADADSWFALCNNYTGINGPDCNDGNAAVHPGVTETCNGIDDNCVGGIDEGVKNTYYLDADSDTYGLLSGTTLACAASGGYVSNSTDCNDGNSAVHPGATEVCNGIDDNCVGGIDEGCPVSNWDTDLDGIPDTYEIAHNSGPMPLDYLNGADGLLDADTDGNPNVHEYWNGTDYRVKDPKGGEGCYYWGDATGDGFIGAVDITILTSRIKGPADYSRVIPNNGETQDLDDNGFWGAVDTTLLSAFAKSDSTTGIATRPSSIEKLSAATASVQVGNTTHVTVALRNLHSTYTVGFGVVFSIDPSSTGTAVILGGDGANGSGYRYDMTGAKSFSARSNVIILVKTAGTIKINASVPQCGMLTDIGRYCSALSMAEPFVITGY